MKYLFVFMFDMLCDLHDSCVNLVYIVCDLGTVSIKQCEDIFYFYHLLNHAVRKIVWCQYLDMLMILWMELPFKILLLAEINALSFPEKQSYN